MTERPLILSEERYVRFTDCLEKEVKIIDLEEEKTIFNIFFIELDSAICLHGGLRDVEDRLNAQDQEIRLFKNTILEALKNERTDLGRSVLRQLAENLELI